MSSSYSMMLKDTRPLKKSEWTIGSVIGAAFAVGVVVLVIYALSGAFSSSLSGGDDHCKLKSRYTTSRLDGLAACHRGCACENDRGDPSSACYRHGTMFQDDDDWHCVGVGAEGAERKCVDGSDPLCCSDETDCEQGSCHAPLYTCESCLRNNCHCVSGNCVKKPESDLYSSETPLDLEYLFDVELVDDFLVEGFPLATPTETSLLPPNQPPGDFIKYQNAKIGSYPVSIVGNNNEGKLVILADRVFVKQCAAPDDAPIAFSCGSTAYRLTIELVSKSGTPHLASGEVRLMGRRM